MFKVGDRVLSLVSSKYTGTVVKIDVSEENDLLDINERIGVVWDGEEEHRLSIPLKSYIRKLTKLEKALK